MTKSKDIKRLTDYGELHKVTPDYLTLDDIQGREVVIGSVEWFEGDYGTYVVMSCELDDEAVKVRTGAKLVLDALVDADANEAFPLLVRFTRRGRTWRFV